MASHTDRFGFTTLDNPLDSVNANGNKFTDADIILLDRLLTHVVERHRHDGVIVSATSEPGPMVTPHRSGGTFPADRDVHYRMGLVDNLGQEHVASQITTVRTFPSLATPEPPALQPTTGTLMAGEYLYTLSAWTFANNQETLVSRPASGALSGFGGFTVSLPQLPVQNFESGWNVYRKGPTDFEPIYLTSMKTTDTAFIDTGAIRPNALRKQPTRNTTSSTTSMSIDRPEYLPANWTVKIYRTLNMTDWANTLWQWSASLPVIDTGHATQHGSPLSSSAGVNGAPKINLDTETVGDPPPGLIATTHNVTFNFAGHVEAGTGEWQWLNEYDNVLLVSMRATLGRDSVPAEQSVLVGLEVKRVDEDSWTRYTDGFLETSLAAEILVGESTSEPRGFYSYHRPWINLARGDLLRPVVIQSGGGVAPTDEDLTLNIKIEVRNGSIDQTHIWAVD